MVGAHQTDRYTDGSRLYIRGLVSAADRLTGVDRFLRREGLLRQVQLLLPLIAERQPPGLEQETRLTIGQHLVGREMSIMTLLLVKTGAARIKLDKHSIVIVAAMQYTAILYCVKAESSTVDYITLRGGKGTAYPGI